MSPIDKVSSSTRANLQGLPTEIIDCVIDAFLGPTPNIHAWFSLSSLHQSFSGARERIEHRISLLGLSEPSTNKSKLASLIHGFRAHPPEIQSILEETVGIFPFPDIHAEPVDEIIELLHRPLINVICSADRGYIDVVEHHYSKLAPRAKAEGFAVPDLTKHFAAAAKRCLTNDEPDIASRFHKLLERNLIDSNAAVNNITQD